jgi:hypothetical protein
MTTPRENASACARLFEHHVRRIGNRRDGDRRRQRGIEVLGHLAHAARHLPLDVARPELALGGVLARLERLELGHRGPLRVDGEPSPVGERQPELDDLPVHAEIGHEHPRRQLREVVAQHVLSRASLRGAAGKDGREPAHDLPRLAFAIAALLLALGETLERAAGGGDLPANLIGSPALGSRPVGQPAELGRLNFQTGLDPGGRGGGTARPALGERETGADRGPGGEREHDEPEGLHGSTVDTRSDTLPGPPTRPPGLGSGARCDG